VSFLALSGNIVVDGVAASVYNTAMGAEARMHAFMVLGRGLWRRAPWLLRAVHCARLAQPLSLAIGRLVATVRSALLDLLDNPHLLFAQLDWLASALHIPRVLGPV
jgi:hypothetical protein